MVHYYEPERTAQRRALVRKGGNPPQIAHKKSISEEGAVHDILQLERNRATKPREEEKCITGKYHRESVLS